MRTPDEVVIHAEKTFAYAIRGYPSRLLTVGNRNGLLYFQEFDRAIGLISGKEMSKRLVQGSRNPPEGMLQLRMLDSEIPLRFSTPESHEKTPVFLGVHDSLFLITGDTSVIGAITGDKLEERLEPVFEKIT